MTIVNVLLHINNGPHLKIGKLNLKFPLKISDQEIKIIMNFELQTKIKKSIYNGSYSTWWDTFGWIFCLHKIWITFKFENRP